MFQKGVIKGVIKVDTGCVLKARASVHITRAKILYFKTKYIINQTTCILQRNKIVYTACMFL